MLTNHPPTNKVFRTLPAPTHLLHIMMLLLACSTYARENTPKGFSQHTTGFIENKGQIIDQDNKPNPGVLYLLNAPGMNVQLRRGGFSYDLYESRVTGCKSRVTGHGSQVTGLDSSSFNFHRIDIDFAGCSSDCMVTATTPSANYLNYYTTGTPADGVTQVRSFSQVNISGIYPGIDVEFLIDYDRGFKYNIIVHPGGDLASVRMKIRGAESGATPAGTLEVRTSLGTIEERIPASHFIGKNSNDQAVVEFESLGNDMFGLRLVNLMPEGATLVVDPIPGRMWATYYGGTDWDSFEYGSCSVDNQGNIISAGITSSTTNIATSGACQTTYKGNTDAFLVKFNSHGQPQWATYYGGAEQENGSNCTADPSGNVFLSGHTSSSENISTPGSHQPIFGGWSDGYLVKFDPNGLRLWATFYGGLEDDGGSSCATDNSGHVYLCGYAHSPNGISTPGSHQPDIASSMGGNAFLAKFEGHILWRICK